MFNFEECELINNFFEDSSEGLTKEKAIERIREAAENTDDSELVAIAEGTIEKLESLSSDEFKMMMMNLPL